MDKTFEDHPPTPDRIEKTQEEIQHILPARKQYLVDTSEFQAVKARLAKLENRTMPEDKKEKVVLHFAAESRAATPAAAIKIKRTTVIRTKIKIKTMIARRCIGAMKAEHPAFRA